MTWAYYLLQVNIYLILFYAFYKLLLDKETYFMMNRLYLLISGVLSLAIPFLRPEWFVKQPVTQQIKISVEQLHTMIAQVTVSPDEAQLPGWGQLAGGVYLLGLLFFLFRFIFHLAAVKRLIENSPSGSAFSFLRKKVIDQNLPELQTIQQHEEIHSRQLHTLDILFFETLAVLVWCNPVVYLYKNTVKDIHEYLADEEAARFQGDKESYALLLLSKAFGIEQHVLTNTFFNKSLIKKRIFMLHKERSKKTAILKYGLFLPLFAGTLLFSSATISRNENLKLVAEKIIAPVIHIPAPPAEVMHLQAVTPAIRPATASRETPGVPVNAGDWSAFYRHLTRGVIYPAPAYEKELQGNTMIKFVLGKGEVNGISVVSPLGLGCDAQVMKNILSFTGFNEIPDGKYCIMVGFRLTDASTAVKNKVITAPAGYSRLNEVIITGFANSGSKPATPSGNAGTGDKVFDFVSLDTQPVFPGGMEMFYKYLSKNVRYPEQAQKNNIQGKVFLSFIIEVDGKVNDVQVVRRLGGGTDEEAVRLLEESPKWTPGISNGRAVRVKYNIPINFTLTDGKAKKS